MNMIAIAAVSRGSGLDCAFSGLIFSNLPTSSRSESVFEILWGETKMGKSSPSLRAVVRASVSACLVAALVSSALSPACAWGLKTHIWVAQQVLNDAHDGYIEVAGKKYRLSQKVADSLRNHPERYRAGALGPDVYPDPLVGQTTTHPGLAAGWQADDWLEFIAANARKSDEVAFSYGYAAHFAGDIFAHTYVNGYAGDVFDILDGEGDVERRHVALEKYIDAHMPLAVDSAGVPVGAASHIKAPSAFLRDHLILRESPSREYRRTLTATHLVMMDGIHHSAEQVEAEAGKVQKLLEDFTEAALSEQKLSEAALIKAKGAVIIAKEKVKSDQLMLTARKESQKQAETAVEEAKKIVLEYRDAYDLQYELYREQRKLTIFLSEKHNELANSFRPVYDSLSSRFNSLKSDLSNLYASTVCTVIDPFGVSPCKKRAKEIIKAMDDINAEIDGMNLQLRTARSAYDAANSKLKDMNSVLKALTEKYREARTSLVNGTLDGAVAAARLEVQAQEAQLKISQGAVKQLESAVELAEKNLGAAVVKAQQAGGGVAGLGAIRALLRNWVRDMDKAAEEYILASNRAGYQMYALEGNPLQTYREWVTCYGPVFAGVPRQIGQGSCFVSNGLSSLSEKIDQYIEELPLLLQWAVNPTRRLEKEALRVLAPEIKKADGRFRAFVSDRSATADVFVLLADPSYATRTKLNQVFSENLSRKRLLKFDRVTDLIDRDIGLKDGRVEPASFPALMHSVTLAKLALLEADALNQLIEDLAPEFAGKRTYSFEVYSNRTILHRSVRSLDGNHQWQAFGLPHPRSSGRLARPKDLGFGRNGFADAGQGLKIWTDPELRQKVFLKLFPGAVIGALGARSELKKPLYPFPACPTNTFPSTQDARGNLQAEDSACP